jgi:hypothetical protein
LEKVKEIIDVYKIIFEDGKIEIKKELERNGELFIASSRNHKISKDSLSIKSWIEVKIQLSEISGLNCYLHYNRGIFEPKFQVSKKMRVCG